MSNRRRHRYNLLIHIERLVAEAIAPAPTHRRTSAAPPRDACYPPVRFRADPSRAPDGQNTPHSALENLTFSTPALRIGATSATLSVFPGGPHARRENPAYAQQRRRKRAAAKVETGEASLGASGERKLPESALPTVTGRNQLAGTFREPALPARRPTSTFKTPSSIFILQFPRITSPCSPWFISFTLRARKYTLLLSSRWPAFLQEPQKYSRPA